MRPAGNNIVDHVHDRRAIADAFHDSISPRNSDQSSIATFVSYKMAAPQSRLLELLKVRYYFARGHDILLTAPS